MLYKVLLPASLVLLGACSWLDRADATLNAELVTAPPEAGYTIGGSVDSVEVDAATGIVTARGWHMLTPKTDSHDLRIYAPGTEAILSVARMARPDVSAAVGDEDLENAGFEVKIKAPPGAALTNFCITFEDEHYGYRLLNPHSPDQVGCDLAG